MWQVASTYLDQWQLRSNLILPVAGPLTDDAFSGTSRGGRLPPVFFAFRGCSWVSGSTHPTLRQLQTDSEHPWDAELRAHIREQHTPGISDAIRPYGGTCTDDGLC